MDLGLLLAVLAGMARAVVEARAEAAHAIMAWAAGGRGVPPASTTLYIAALHARPSWAWLIQGPPHLPRGCFTEGLFCGVLAISAVKIALTVLLDGQPQTALAESKGTMKKGMLCGQGAPIRIRD